MHVIVMIVVIGAIIAVTVVSVLILAFQGITQGIVSLTIISVVVGMVIGILSLMFNFFQVYSPTPHAQSDPAASSPAERQPAVSSGSIDVPDAQEPHGLYGKQAREDRGNALVIKPCYGRRDELRTLKQWVRTDTCSIIGILGMGGVGKTTLCTELAQQEQEEFEYIFWRSLHHMPPPEEFLASCIAFLSDQQCADLSREDEVLIDILIQYLREHRCLLIVDSFEAVMQHGNHAGAYVEGYEGYGALLERVGGGGHRSCLIFTSREKPREMLRLEGNVSPVRSLHLIGMDANAAQDLLQNLDLFGSDTTWTHFVSRYAGNPLSLKLASEPIRELFQGDINAFLEQEEVITSDIQHLLTQQFQRLSGLEQEVMYWLAIAREPLSLDTLRTDIIHPIPKKELLDALLSLKRRFLIETSGVANFVLHSVIVEYVTERFVRQIAYEIESGELDLLNSHALMQTQVRDYVRMNQHRFILTALMQSLHALHRQRMVPDEEIAQKLLSLLALLRTPGMSKDGYAAGNILNLLASLSATLRDYDFSHLVIRQAYLQRTRLFSVNFADAHFQDCSFTGTFSNILSLAWGSRQSILAAGTASGELWIWQMPGGSVMSRLSGHSDWVRSVAFTADEIMVVSGSDDQSVRLWDVSNGSCLRTLQGHHGRIYCVACSPDGRVIASGSDDQTIRVWETASGKLVTTLQGHGTRVRSIAFSPDSKLLAAGCEEQGVWLWDIGNGGDTQDTETNRCVRILQEPQRRVYAVSFSTDGTMLVSGSDAHTLTVWDVNTGRSLHMLQGHTAIVRCVAFSEHALIVSGSDDSTIRVWDASTGTCVGTLQGHESKVRTVACNADGTFVASGDDQSWRLWEVITGKCLKTLRGYRNWIYAVAYSPDGALLACDNENGSIGIWDTRTGNCLKVLQGHTSWVYSIAYSPDGSMIVSASDDSTIRLWDTNTGRYTKVLSGSRRSRVRSIAFSPDGSVVVSGSDNHSLCLWDVYTGRCLHTLSGHDSRVYAVAMSSDGRLIASGSDDQTIRLWEFHSGSCIKVFAESPGRVWSVDFAPGQNVLASGSDDQNVRIWDLATACCLHILAGHRGRVYSVAFSPRGDLLASGSEDRTVRLWEVATGRCLCILTGHTERVRSISFSSDGQTLASGSHDGTMKMWDVPSGQCVRTLRGERPYENINIKGATGITEAQRATLMLLGAVEKE